MKIGNVNLKSNLVLAPLAGYTDGGLRYLCANYGCGLTYTEMVSAKGLCYGNVGTETLLFTSDNENPKAVQLFGSEYEFISKAVQHPLIQKFDIIDINMGCPVHKIVKNGEGSSLLLHPDKVYDIVKSAVDSTDKPITCKIRAGFDSDHINAVEIANIIEKAGASAVTVHGRTREQFYSGSANIDIIKQVKESVTIPVIGNGDVVSKDDYNHMLDYTHCDGVMVGRGAIGRPFIFAQFIDKPFDFDVKACVLQHIDVLKKYLNEKTVVNQMKMQLCFYAKNTGHSKDVRREIATLKNINDVYFIVDKYF